MKTKIVKLLCLALAGLMLLSTFIACGDQVDTPDAQTTGSVTEADTNDEVQMALDELKADLNTAGDWGGETFSVLYLASFKNEVYGENGTVDKDNGASQVINDAVYERNLAVETDLGVELDDLGLQPDDLECNSCANVPTLFEGLDRE